MNGIDTQTTISGMKTLENQAARLKRENDLKKATQGFEAIFLNSMMKSMRQTLPGNAVFKESNASNIYQSMYDQYLTDELSKGKQTTGLKELLYEKLKDRI